MSIAKFGRIHRRTSRLPPAIDPWPKRKHRKNRLLNEHFTEIAARALKPRGAVYLRTDDADYFDQMTRVFGANIHFQKIQTPSDLAAIQTDFERTFHARGIHTLHAAYRLAQS